MAAGPEGEVITRVRAARVEAVRVGEVGGVPVGRAQHALDGLVRRDLHAPDLDRLGGEAGAGLNRGIPPHRLLDHGFDLRGISHHGPRNGWMGQHGPQRVADHRLGRLDPAEEDDQQVRDHLGIGEVVRIRPVAQHRDHRPLGYGLLPAQKGRHIVTELARGLLPRCTHVGVTREVLERGGEAAVPPDQSRPVLLRQPQDAADAPPRQRTRHPCTQIGGPAHLRVPRVPLQLPHHLVEHGLHRPEQVALQLPPPERPDEAPLVPDLRLTIGREHVGPEDVPDVRRGRVGGEALPVGEDPHNVVPSREQPHAQLRRPRHRLGRPQLVEDGVRVVRECVNGQTGPERVPMGPIVQFVRHNRVYLADKPAKSSLAAAPRLVRPWL